MRIYSSPQPVLEAREVLATVMEPSAPRSAPGFSLCLKFQLCWVRAQRDAKVSAKLLHSQSLELNLYLAKKSWHPHPSLPSMLPHCLPLCHSSGQLCWRCGTKVCVTKMVSRCSVEVIGPTFSLLPIQGKMLLSTPKFILGHRRFSWGQHRA